jgi:hypothetical protein
MTKAEDSESDPSAGPGRTTHGPWARAAGDDRALGRGKLRIATILGWSPSSVSWV